MWLEASGLGQAMRGAGVWAYGVTNLVHILGVATLFGSVLVLDLRLLGAFARAPIAAVAAPTVPLAMTGFALGLVNALALGSVPAWRERGARELTPGERRQLKWFGGVSLASWLTALACG